jgi:hypothetical protein
MSSNAKRGYAVGGTAKRARKSTYTVLGYDRSRGGLMAGARQKSALRLLAASKETGYVDTALATYACNTTGSVTLLNTVAQGAAVTQRVGKKIVMKGLQCRGQISCGSAGDIANAAYMIVYDKRPTGSLPSITDILVSVSSNSMNNDANAGRFRIVKREDVVITGNDAASANITDTSRVLATWWLDLKQMPTVFKAAATGAIGDIEEGALYLVTVGDETGTVAPNLTVGFRLRFLDV